MVSAKNAGGFRGFVGGVAGDAKSTDDINMETQVSREIL